MRSILYTMTQTFPSYTTSSAQMAQESVSVAHLQSVVPGFPLGGRIPIDPRLMPADGVMSQSAKSHHDKDNPCHLVGSQKPVTPASGIAATKAYIPQKNADGKFVCTTVSVLPMILYPLSLRCSHN
jgi:hypothetical protein